MRLCFAPSKVAKDTDSRQPMFSVVEEKAQIAMISATMGWQTGFAWIPQSPGSSYSLATSPYAAERLEVTLATSPHRECLTVTLATIPHRKCLTVTSVAMSWWRALGTRLFNFWGGGDEGGRVAGDPAACRVLHVHLSVHAPEV